MTRKLHNTLMAVIASSSLLVVGLIAGAPLDPKHDAAVLASMTADTDSLIETVEQQDTSPSRQTRGARHSRQALAMPFYSFAPRG